MTLQGGSRLGPYEILAPIGAGGMGEVYRASGAAVDSRSDIFSLGSVLYEMLSGRRPSHGGPAPRR